MKVSVAVLTYNHEKFIAQALDSILMQQVNFDYEIFIGEDCSTDNTRDIVIDYHNRYPDKIHLLLHKKNVGATNNDIQIDKACRGEYIAYLEGDDYWTSSHKLQKQVEYLDNHPECSACFHTVTVFYEDGIYKSYGDPPQPKRKSIYTLVDLLENTTIATGAIMYRNNIVKEYPNWYHTCEISDWPFWIFLAQHGNIGFIDQVLGAYRIHNRGMYSGVSCLTNLTNRVELLENLNTYLEFRYDKIYKDMISELYIALALEYAIVKDLTNARTCFKKSVSQYTLSSRISLKKLLKTFLKLYFPSLYKPLSNRL